MITTSPPKVRRMVALIIAALGLHVGGLGDAGSWYGPHPARPADEHYLVHAAGEDRKLPGPAHGSLGFRFLRLLPRILDRKNAMRPLQAYGLSAGLIWVTWCALAPPVFQDMLVLKSSNFEGTTGGFCAIGC